MSNDLIVYENKKEEPRKLTFLGRVEHSNNSSNESSYSIYDQMRNISNQERYWNAHQHQQSGFSSVFSSYF